MGTSKAQGLRGSSVPSKRTRSSLETVESLVGTPAGSWPEYYTSSKKAPSKRKLGNNTKGSLDKADKR